MLAETWLPLPGHAGIYEVSDLGRVRSVDRTVLRTRIVRGHPRVATWSLKGTVLKASLNTAGYPQVRLQGGRIARVHTLVLETFVGPRPDGMECRHGDANRKNAALSNLQWGTRLENMADMRRHGNYRGGARPGDTPGAKLTPDQVREIRERGAMGHCNRDLALAYSVTRPTISRIVNRKIWTHV